MTLRPRGILSLALRTMGDRNPNVRGPLPPVATWPRDPEQILHLCNGGKAVVSHVGRLAERYRTTNGHILKVCSLIREHSPGGSTYLGFEQVRSILLASLLTFGDEYRLRQNANHGAGTFPEIVTECEPRGYTPRPVPSAAQQAEWDEEHDRLTRDPQKRLIARNATTVRKKVHKVNPTIASLEGF